MNRNYRKTKRTLNIVVKYIEENIKEYFIISLIYLFGLIIGIIFINKLSNENLNYLSTYLNDFIVNIKNNTNVDFWLLLKESIRRNFVLVLILWFMGSTVIGILIAYFVIFFKGLCLGYTASAIVFTFGAFKGTLFLITAMLFQNIILIPCIISLGVSCIKLYKSIIENRRKENIKLEIIRHTLFSIFIFTILILSSLIEVYVSIRLLILVIPYL